MRAGSCARRLVSERAVVRARERRKGTHYDVWAVRRSEHDDAVELLDAVHLGEEAHEDPVAGRTAALLRASRRRERIDLVLRARVIR